MLKSLLSYNPIGKTFFSFEQSEQDDHTTILGMEVLQKKDELDVIQNFIVHDITAIAVITKTAVKANLIITDSNVLTKEVFVTASDQEVLSEAYPNLNLDDFYYQILKTTTRSFVAVCRKAYVDTVITQYKKANISITTIDLGILKTTALLSYISDAEVMTYTSVITLDTNEVIAIGVNHGDTQNYTIDTITIPSTHTLPFAAILDTVTNQTRISGNIEDKNLELKHQYKESQFFKKTLQYSVTFLLISLLINFFIFNSKYKSWQGLQEEQQIYTTQKERIKKQQFIVSTKEAIVTSIVHTGFSRSSFYVDQIIQSQPETVLLTTFIYQPVTKTMRNDKPISFKKNTITITGDSTDKLSFTTWLNRIESLEYVQGVTIINYGLSTKNTADFEIAINLIDDTEK
ncbi:hypothetical protein [Aquimarina sp. RZ0]|uniref:hypothetical protein n=1 Tax=Aquimarina sp. RZ0 TaxID=2607730 RepID=UPI0011F1B96C|nr:hypothetical protein [Aquimarina sp. RZ0]KAA1247608.1 hypothetical protein F0000_02030 [Aquimarina sp. RZ0]